MVVDDTVESKDNKEETTREFADIRMYHFSWNCLQPGCDMLWCWWFLCEIDPWKGPGSSDMEALRY